MFTLDQIGAIHEQWGKANTLPQYLHALHDIGINTYDSFIADGHSEYIGDDRKSVISQPIYSKIVVADVANREEMLKHLELHKQQKTSYFEMTKGLAESGVMKWTFDTTKLTITYLDKAGNVLLTEAIK